MEQRHVPTEPRGGGREEERQGWYSRFIAFIVRLNDASKFIVFLYAYSTMYESFTNCM